MDNPETQEILGTRHRAKTNKEHHTTHSKLKRGAKKKKKKKKHSPKKP